MIDLEKTVINALAFCIEGTSEFRTQADVIAGLNRGNYTVNSRLRRYIARDVAGYLSEKYGSRIKASRLYGSTADYTACTFSDIDMIVLVTDLPADFSKTIAEMDQILSDAYYSLLGKDAGDRSYLLDLHVINEDPDVRIQPSKAYLEHILLYESVVA